jgi:hypothetical protein
MKPADQIPYYAPDGASLGFRSVEAAKRLIENGFVKPSHGRKGHLKAIWARRESTNAKILWVKYKARGSRNKQNFVHAIYFHCGADLQRQ